jgi:ABC-type uncharacterized transport system involved in gliding motility auxiliary subunit
MQHEPQFRSYLLGKVVLRTALLLGIISFGFLAVQNWVVRWDLTEDKRFSISEASHKIAGSLEDPLTIRAYFSDKIPDRIVPMQQQVFDILAEYEAHGNGKIKVERYDPLESSSAASEAQSYGVRPIQLRVLEATEASALQVYGSIVLISGDRASEVINIAERYPEGYEGLSVLEPEISSKIWQLTHERPKVGLTGYLEREAGRANPMMGMPQPRPEFAGFRTKLGETFEIEDVDLDSEELDPGKVPLLIVVRPKEFTDVALFRLDQYLMKGGRVLVFVTQGVIDQAQWGDHQFTYEPFKTGLDGWFEHHGLRVPNEFVLHFVNATPIGVVSVKEMGGMRLKGEFPEPNWFWPLVSATAEAFDKDNPAVQPLKMVSLWWPHPVDLIENKLGEKRATVLVRSHPEESWRWKDVRRIDRRSLSEDRDGPRTSELLSSPLAVAVDGVFTSYFADKPVPPSLTKGNEEGPKEGAEGEKKEEGAGNPEKPAEGEKPVAAGPEVRKASAPTQLVVVGNAFFFTDPLIGQSGERAEEMALFALNLVDWLAGSPELIALRAKHYADRKIVSKVEERFKEVREKVEKGEIEEEEAHQLIQGAEEAEKAGWKRSRWLNIILPCFVIGLAGAIVWIVRAANRGAAARIPAAEPPASLSGGGTDS